METIHINISGRQTRPIAMHHANAEWDELARYEPLTTVFHNNHTWLVINTIPETLVGSENMSPNVDIVNWCPFARHFFLTTQATEAGDITARINGVVTRIPIGTNGQILAVDDGTLQWIDVSLEGGRVLGSVIDERGLVTSRGQANIPAEAFALRNKKPYYEVTASGRYGLRNNNSIDETLTVPDNIHEGRGGGSVLNGFAFFMTFSYLPPELREGLITSSNNPITSTPYSGDGEIRNGRFYRSLRNDAFGGLLNLDQPRETLDPWRGQSFLIEDRTTEWIPVNPVDPEYYNESHVQEALLLTTTGTTSSTLTLATNHNRATGEWDIFNSATAPNDRGLEVIDWVETQDLFFIFLCKPVGDDDENNRTLWAMGGLQFYQRTNSRTTNRLCWTQRNDLRENRGVIISFAGGNGNSVVTQATLRAPQFTYKLRELTQISVAGAYDALFLADDDYQYSNVLHIPADSLTTGGHFAVRMTDGTYQLHAPFHDNVQRDNTSTALREYPASVTNRDLFVFNGQDRTSWTATQNQWRQTSGAANPDTAIQIGGNFEFWKTGDSTITGVFRNNNEGTRTERNYTVGNSETIIQLKMITVWEIPYVQNFRLGDTSVSGSPSYPPQRQVTGFNGYIGFADGTNAFDATARPAQQQSVYPARLMLVAVTEEGNVWVGGVDSTRAPLFSNNPTVLHTADVQLTEQTGAEFRGVDRIEYTMNYNGDTTINFTGGSYSNCTVVMTNRLSIIRGNRVFVRKTEFPSRWLVDSFMIVDIFNGIQEAYMTVGLFYDSYDWVIPTDGFSITGVVNWNSFITPTSIFNPRMDMSRGLAPHRPGFIPETRKSYGNERCVVEIETFEYTLTIGEISRLFWWHNDLYCINNLGTVYRSSATTFTTTPVRVSDTEIRDEDTRVTWAHRTGAFQPLRSVNGSRRLFAREVD